MRAAHLIAAFAFLLAACPEDDVSPGADADVSDDAAEVTPDSDIPSDTTPDTGGDGGAIVLVDDPIIARTPLGTATCSVAREVTRVDDEFEVQFQFESMLSLGDEVLVTRSGKTVSLAKLARDGSATDEVVLDPDEYSSGQAAAALAGGSLAVVWQTVSQATNQGGLRFARIAVSDLAIEVPGRDLQLGFGGYYQTQSVLVADGAGGFALLYNEDGDLRFVRLGADGAPGTPVIVIEGQPGWFAFAQNMIRTAAGEYAITWTQGPYDASEIYFARLAADGAVVSGPHRLSRAGGGGTSANTGWRANGGALIEVGDRLWAVFSESHSTGEPFVDQKTSVIARLAVFDHDGRGEAHALQAPVDDMTVENPTLVPYRDGIALVWSYGTLIYICAGCIADYDIHLALLDPTTLDPLTVPAIAVSANNGYRNPRAAPLGDELLVTTAIDFHALWYPATGVLACTP